VPFPVLGPPRRIPGPARLPSRRAPERAEPTQRRRRQLQRAAQQGLCARAGQSPVVEPMKVSGRLLSAAATVCILVLLALPWAGSGGRPLATPGPARAGAVLMPHALYTVQPGDTLWSIAQRLAPGSDPRVVLTVLTAEVGDRTLAPGERLMLP
jgi:hypothetical protein